jgi:hypothetical protein
MTKFPDCEGRSSTSSARSCGNQTEIGQCEQSVTRRIRSTTVLKFVHRIVHIHLDARVERFHSNGLSWYSSTVYSTESNLKIS